LPPSGGAAFVVAGGPVCFSSRGASSFRSGPITALVRYFGLCSSFAGFRQLEFSIRFKSFNQGIAFAWRVCGQPEEMKRFAVSSLTSKRHSGLSAEGVRRRRG